MCVWIWHPFFNPTFCKLIQSKLTRETKVQNFFIKQSSRQYNFVSWQLEAWLMKQRRSFRDLCVWVNWCINIKSCLKQFLNKQLFGVKNKIEIIVVYYFFFISIAVNGYCDGKREQVALREREFDYQHMFDLIAETSAIWVSLKSEEFSKINGYLIVYATAEILCQLRLGRRKSSLTFFKIMSLRSN